MAKKERKHIKGKGNSIENLIEKMQNFSQEELEYALENIGFISTPITTSPVIIAAACVAHTYTLRKCQPREIGEIEEGEMCRCITVTLNGKGNVNDKVELWLPGGTEAANTWTIVNNSSQWCGKIKKGKYYLHYKGRDNARSVTWDIQGCS